MTIFFADRCWWDPLAVMAELISVYSLMCVPPWYTEFEEFAAVFGLLPGYVPFHSHPLTDNLVDFVVRRQDLK
jgi:hypothetical protein